MCGWNSEGEESCTQIGHQEKKKKKRHILLRELTSWTPKLHWHIMRGMMQGGREERKGAELTEEGERKHFNLNIMLFLTVVKSSSLVFYLGFFFLFFFTRPQRMLRLFLSQHHIKLSSTPWLLSKTWHGSPCFQACAKKKKSLGGKTLQRPAGTSGAF